MSRCGRAATGRPATTSGRRWPCSHAIAADIGVRELRARAHTGLGHAHLGLGDPAVAREHYAQALTLYTELDMPEAEEIRARLKAPQVRLRSESAAHPARSATLK